MRFGITYFETRKPPFNYGIFEKKRAGNSINTVPGLHQRPRGDSNTRLDYPVYDMNKADTWYTIQERIRAAPT